MQRVHFVAALDGQARFVHFFSCRSVRFPPGSEPTIGQSLGSNAVDEVTGRLLRATFSECLYSDEPQECIIQGASGASVQCRFEKVFHNADRTFRSEDEVVAIAVACEIPGPCVLSQREQEITKMICRDLSNADIAHELGLKSSTVESHRQNIRKKLGVRGTSGIVLYAYRCGLVDDQ